METNNQYDFFKNVNLDANGNLGVNLVSGGTGSSQWIDDTNGIYYSSGSVGIGDVTTPLASNTKLTIELTDNTERALRIRNNDSNSQFNMWPLLQDGVHMFRFDSDNTGLTPLALASTGKVGINIPTFGPSGITTPQATLHVTSVLSGTPLVLIEDTYNVDTTPFIIDEDGNVGIGTGNPQANLDVNGQIKVLTSTGNTFTANAFDYDCDAGMVQEVDGQGMSANGTLTFSNQKEGSTYVLIFIQGSGLYNVTLPTGYWLDTTAFDFTTLADNERAMITATYLNGNWYFAVKELTLI